MLKCMQLPTDDHIMDEMGIRVADMDHLPSAVCEDIAEAAAGIAANLEVVNRAAKAADGDKAYQFKDIDLFRKVYEILSSRYYHQGRHGRLFVLTTIANIVVQEHEEKESNDGVPEVE